MVHINFTCMRQVNALLSKNCCYISLLTVNQLATVVINSPPTHVYAIF